MEYSNKFPVCATESLLVFRKFSMCHDTFDGVIMDAHPVALASL